MKLNSIAFSFAFGALILTALATVARAQSGGPFDLSWSTIHAGGGTRAGSTGGADTSASSQFTLTGTIGQPDAGTTTLRGGQFSLTGGLWDVMAALNEKLEFIGYLIIAVFIGSWLLSMLIYRLRGYDSIEVPPSHQLAS